MKIKVVLLATASSLALAFPAFAQSSDSTYCAALSHQYTKLVADPNAGKVHVATPADVAAAQSKCGSDPASAIPVLEKALTDHKVALPPRS